MRWCSIALLVLMACTADNPEFGLESSGSTGSAPTSGTTTSSTSSSTGSEAETSVDSSSGESGTIASCAEPDDRVTRIRVVGENVGAGATHGAIRRTSNGLEVDCDHPCAVDITGGCLRVGFEIEPPLWEEWSPPDGCFRFQWLGADPEAVDELRVGLESMGDELMVLGAEPLFAKTYDVELKLREHCSCDERECCPIDAGDYGFVVHTPEDVVLGEAMSVYEDVEWMGGHYRLENGGSSIVPDCVHPKRIQFRAYQIH